MRHPRGSMNSSATPSKPWPTFNSAPMTGRIRVCPVSVPCTADAEDRRSFVAGQRIDVRQLDLLEAPDAQARREPLLELVEHLELRHRRRRAPTPILSGPRSTAPVSDPCESAGSQQVWSAIEEVVENERARTAGVSGARTPVREHTAPGVRVTAEAHGDRARATGAADRCPQRTMSPGSLRLHRSSRSEAGGR